ncbi:MAG: ABC transporter ATP-binding protein [Chloroflexi bacterium]|nr:MAG: ABC transporter ATP-binding protein [Chloroflexota bacterium]
MFIFNTGFGQKVAFFGSQLKYVPRAVGLVWHAARGYTVAWGVLLLIQGLVPAATVYLTRVFVDALVVAIQQDGAWEAVQPALWLALLMGAIMVVSQVLGSISEWVGVAQAEYVEEYLMSLVHHKSTTVDLAFYEMPEYHDKLHQAQSELSSRPLALLESGGSLAQNSITLISMMLLLLPYGVWLPLVLFVSTLPAFYVVVRYNRTYHRWWEETTADRRWLGYYSSILTLDAIAAEVRLFNLGPHFQERFVTIQRHLRDGGLRIIRNRGVARLLASLSAMLITGLALLWMVWRGFTGAVTLGDLALFYQAFNRGQDVLRSLLSNLGQIYDNILFLENLFAFLDLQPEVRSPANPAPAPAPLRGGIEFKNVTFRYPGTERPVFENFNFSVPAGKVVAVVGSNGVGKTTMLKLLCRFYDPESGSIQLDGVDLRDLSVEELRRMTTVMFQFPMLYSDTAGGNIALGDLDANPSQTQIEAAARRAGAHEFISRLPKGYNSLMTKTFSSGTELSGGERQRLALARAFLRQAQIMILDEPTSLMDSWSEIDWFDRFRELAQGRTAIIITHRFTIAKDADLIFVMDRGQVVEAGNHAELMALDGLYAESWRAQTGEPASARAPHANGTNGKNGVAAAAHPTNGREHSNAI